MERVMTYWEITSLESCIIELSVCFQKNQHHIGTRSYRLRNCETRVVLQQRRCGSWSIVYLAQTDHSNLAPFGATLPVCFKKFGYLREVTVTFQKERLETQLNDGTTPGDDEPTAVGVAAIIFREVWRSESTAISRQSLRFTVDDRIHQRRNDSCSRQLNDQQSWQDDDLHFGSAGDKLTAITWPTSLISMISLSFDHQVHWSLDRWNVAVKNVNIIKMCC